MEGIWGFELMKLFGPQEMVIWNCAQNQGTCCTQVNGLVTHRNRRHEPEPAVLGALGKAVGLKDSIDCVSQGRTLGTC